MSSPFQKPLHPMNRFAHKHGKAEKTDTATKPGRHGRARSTGEGGVLRCSKRLVISTGNHALRGAVNWGAEKNKDRGVGGADQDRYSLSDTGVSNASASF